MPAPLVEADFLPVDPALARIGRLLFYDRILSGNRNIACGTCHHHAYGGADGLSLGIGEGGAGLGPARRAGTDQDRIHQRMARHTPAMWNLGHRSVRALFHDGRVAYAPDGQDGRAARAPDGAVSDAAGRSRFRSPAGPLLPPDLPDVVAVQALFPMAARLEMAGDPGENDIADALGTGQAWPMLAARVAAIPAYSAAFIAADPTIERPDQIGIAQIATALSHFIRSEWRSHDSPFDAYLAGRSEALSPVQRTGLALFYGRAGCGGCHGGPLLTDHGYHALALPTFGPGRTRPFDPMPRDLGRMAASDRVEDAYRFRTPSLRNVALTAPYGHNGAYPTLAGIIRHHADPLAALDRWDRGLAALAEAPWLAESDFAVAEDRLESARHRRALDIRPAPLSEDDIAALLAFLHSLTGGAAHAPPLGRPDRVPSGLPVDVEAVKLLDRPVDPRVERPEDRARDHRRDAPGQRRRPVPVP